MICEQEHLSLLKVEEFLKDDLERNLHLDEESGCWLPSTIFNVVFLPLHFAGHFVYGGANLRQIVDYAFPHSVLLQCPSPLSVHQHTALFHRSKHPNHHSLDV